jgi:hypothetical protein
MRRVVIESPWGKRPDGSSCTVKELERNERYLHRAIRDCLARGESPYASHGFFPGALQDTTPHERESGITAGFEWGRMADLVVVYADHGITPGMDRGISYYLARGMLIERRYIGEEQ